MGLVEPHARRQSPEELGVGDRLAQRRDRGHVEAQVEVPPRVHDVELLELGRGGQHDVGEVGGVSGELLADDGEQVLARQSRDDLVLLGHDDDGIAVVDEQRLDRRRQPELAGQGGSEPPLIDDPCAGPDEVGTQQHVPLEREGPDGHL